MVLSYCGLLELSYVVWRGTLPGISLLCTGDGHVEIMVMETGKFRIKIRVKEEVENKAALKS